MNEVVKKAIFPSIILLMTVGIGVWYNLNMCQPSPLPKEMTEIAENIEVVVQESDSKNRTLFLDTSQWYCKSFVCRGGSDPYPWDLAYPNAQIVFFFLEDVKFPKLADNYSDLIVRMNLIEDDGKRKMVLVFFAEGGYDKFVYYKSDLLHHYRDEDETSNYGIKLIEVCGNA